MTRSAEVLAAELDGLRALVSAEFRARDAALDQLAQETERVRAQQNEWRGTVTDLAAGKVDKDALDAKLAVIESKVDRLTKESDQRGGGRTALSIGWGLGLAALGAAGTIIGIVLALTR